MLTKILLTLCGRAIGPFVGESQRGPGLFWVIKKAQDRGVPVLAGAEELWQQVLTAKRSIGSGRASQKSLF